MYDSRSASESESPSGFSSNVFHMLPLTGVILDNPAAVTPGRVSTACRPRS